METEQRIPASRSHYLSCCPKLHSQIDSLEKRLNMLLSSIEKMISLLEKLLENMLDEILSRLKEEFSRFFVSLIKELENMNPVVAIASKGNLKAVLESSAGAGCTLMKSLFRNKECQEFIVNFHGQGQSMNRLEKIAFGKWLGEKKAQRLSGLEPDPDNKIRGMMPEILGSVWPGFDDMTISADTFNFTYQAGHLIELLCGGNDVTKTPPTYSRAILVDLIVSRAKKEKGRPAQTCVVWMIACLGKQGGGTADWLRGFSRQVAILSPEIVVPALSSLDKTFAIIEREIAAKLPTYKTDILQTAKQANPAVVALTDEQYEIGLNSYISQMIDSLLDVAGSLGNDRIKDKVTRVKFSGFTATELVSKTIVATAAKFPWHIFKNGQEGAEFVDEWGELEKSVARAKRAPYACLLSMTGNQSKFPKLTYLCKQIQIKVLGATTWSGYQGGAAGPHLGRLNQYVESLVTAYTIQGAPAPLVASTLTAADMALIKNNWP